MKVALVTGGSSGIGKAVVIRLAQTGYRVVACSRNLDSLAKVKNELSNKGLSIDIHSLDLQCEESIKACFSNSFKDLKPKLAKISLTS